MSGRLSSLSTLSKADCLVRESFSFLVILTNGMGRIRQEMIPKGSSGCGPSSPAGLPMEHLLAKPIREADSNDVLVTWA